MQQHPIPQNVTQYQFRLVGDMTLKQFLELAGGLLVGYLFYASNLIFLLKWPLALTGVLGGIALAFFPLEDRPLDLWIINFIKAIYAPTRFTWQKTNKIPSLFLFAAHAPDIVNTITKTIKAPTFSPTISQGSDLSELETKQISSVDALFSTLPQIPRDTINLTPSPNPAIKPTIAIRKLHPQIIIPQAAPVKIETPIVPPPVTHPNVAPITQSVVFQAPSAPHTTSSLASVAPAKNITLPASPKTPNLLTGVIVDQTDKLVENAIIQIVSADGIPARAMKTNSLGQFYTSTPLPPGKYVIEIEKEGLTFTPQQIMINNTILSPIELHATI